MFQIETLNRFFLHLFECERWRLGKKAKTLALTQFRYMMLPEHFSDKAGPSFIGHFSSGLKFGSTRTDVQKFGENHFLKSLKGVQRERDFDTCILDSLYKFSL